MSNYSFIENNNNDPNKHCYCVDLNSSSMPYIINKKQVPIQTDNIQIENMQMENNIDTSQNNKVQKERTIDKEENFYRLNKPELDLNNISNTDNKVYNNLNYNSNLLENFNCPNTCSLKKTSNEEKDNGFNETFFVLILIIILLIMSYFYK
jgi:hypothetical protein